jgi:hypothetical protein
MVFSQDTGVNSPTISAMGSLVTTESQDTRLTSYLKHSALHRAMSPITALGHFDIIFRPEERVPPNCLPTPVPVASGLPSRTNPAYLQRQASRGMKGGMLLVFTFIHRA